MFDPLGQTSRLALAAVVHDCAHGQVDNRVDSRRCRYTREVGGHVERDGLACVEGEKQRCNCVQHAASQVIELKVLVGRGGPTGAHRGMGQTSEAL